MTINISQREWEALSAFLDNQLSEKEKIRLEARLKQEPALQEALDGLRRTRIILRSQPRMRAPRNFTLTQAMVGQKTRERSLPRSYPIFRLASAFATILLVFVFLGDLFGTAPVIPQQDFALTSEEQQRRALAPEGYGDVLSMEAAPAEAPEAVMGAQAQPAPEEAASAAGAELRASEDAAVEKEVPPDLEIANAQGVGGGVEVEAEPRAPLFSNTFLLVLEISLLTLAFGAGLAAFLIRRSAR